MSARVCIIGAGSSGIAAAQVLHARGIDFDCFELGSEVGGNWRYQNDNGMSSAYKSLHINTSRQLMEFKAYPMPEDLPDYPNHWQIAEYFDSYVDHFGFRDKIAFRTEVVKVEPVASTSTTTAGRYAVTLRSRNEHGESSEPEVRHYEHVIVANGHHWDPRWPEPSFPGAESFPGEQIHAHYYKTPDVFAGRRVLVLGIGNSACDIAVESSRVADETFLAMRRGAHVVPKFIFGVPTDHLTDSVVARMPLKVQQVSMAAMLRLAQGKVTDYGLPKPDHAVLHAHPTVSDDLLTRLGHGDITVKPNIDRFEGSKVFFEDGSAAEVDTVVYCTGYKVTFPFFDDKVVRSQDNHVDLYRRVVDPEHPRSLLRRADPAARRDHAARRDPGRVGRGSRQRRGRAPVVRRDAHPDQGVRRAAPQALRGVQEAHDPGRLPQVLRRDRAGAPRVARPRSGPARRACRAGEAGSERRRPEPGRRRPQPPFLTRRVGTNAGPGPVESARMLAPDRSSRHECWPRGGRVGTNAAPSAVAVSCSRAAPGERRSTRPCRSRGPTPGWRARTTPTACTG